MCADRRCESTEQAIGRLEDVLLVGLVVGELLGERRRGVVVYVTSRHLPGRVRWSLPALSVDRFTVGK